MPDPNDPLRIIPFPPAVRHSASDRAAERYAGAARSVSTSAAYDSDWRDFSAWCLVDGRTSLPATADTVRLYIAALAVNGRKVSTIARPMASVSFFHRRQGMSSPCSMTDPALRETWQGIRRTLGVRPNGKKAITLKLLRKVVLRAGNSLRATRDRALFLVGFAGGLRCSELAGLRIEDLLPHPGGITLLLSASKTDQAAAGREVELVRGKQPKNTPEEKLLCPVRALGAWLVQANIRSGRVFRSVSAKGTVGASLRPASIRWILRQGLLRAGAYPEVVHSYGAHSLRTGFVTLAYKNGAREIDIAEQTGHRSLSTLRRYIRNQRARRSAARSLGL